MSFPEGLIPFYNRHKIKINSLGIGVVIAFCLFASRQDIMEASKPFADNPSLFIQNFWLYFVIGVVFILVMILISKLIERFGLGDNFQSPPF